MRPLLLRVQAQTFASARHRDAAMTASFESIALGLLPLVADDVLAEVSAILRTCLDTPTTVLAALRSRLEGRAETLSTIAAAPEGDALTDAADLPSLLARSDPSADLAIARDPHARLDGRALGILVDRAAHRPDLARALLARPEPGRFDRAALYRHADPAQRALIRRDLASVAALSSMPRPRGFGELAPRVLAAAECGDLGTILALAVSRLGTDPQMLEPGDPVGRELFALALLALGLDDAESIRAIILLGTEASRSVGMMTELARIVRGTPWPVAAFLTGREGPARQDSYAENRRAPARAVGTLRPDGRLDPGRPDLHARWERSPAQTVQADRRS